MRVGAERLEKGERGAACGGATSAGPGALAYAVSASNTLDQLGLDPGSSLEISYRA